jgi:hypothetical protein
MNRENTEQSDIRENPATCDTPRELWVAYYHTRIWSAHYPDWSALVVFTNELAALRYAGDNHMWVAKILPGIPVREQVP